MSLHGSGIHDTARVLKISPTTVTNELNKRKHLTLRTRIKRLTRKTLCFSKSIQMHDIVMGLFVNRYEFGLPVCDP